MSKTDYGLQKAFGKLSYQDEKLEKVIEKALKRVKKERDKKHEPKVTRLVERKGDDKYFGESYHEEMEELARQARQEEGYLSDNDIEQF
jgi:hypothetical protein